MFSGSKRRAVISAAALAAVTILSNVHSVSAAQYDWDVTKTGTQQWNVDANWLVTDVPPYPQTAGDVANVNGNFTVLTSVVPSADAVVGVLGPVAIVRGQRVAVKIIQRDGEVRLAAFEPLEDRRVEFVRASMLRDRALEGHPAAHIGAGDEVVDDAGRGVRTVDG